MNEFNPWPFVEGARDLKSAALSELQHLQIKWAQDLEAHRPSNGFDVLRAIVDCNSNRIPVPEWLVEDSRARLQTVTHFHVGSLDDPRAFGPVPSTQGSHLSTAAARARWGPLLTALFCGEKNLPRTLEGFKKAAHITGLTPKQVRALTPKTRSNRRGHKPYGTAVSAPETAHDPFSLAPKKA